MIEITPENKLKLMSRKTCDNQTDLVRMFVEVSPWHCWSGNLISTYDRLHYRCSASSDQPIARVNRVNSKFVCVYVPEGKQWNFILGKKAMKVVQKVIDIIVKNYFQSNECGIHIRLVGLKYTPQNLRWLRSIIMSPPLPRTVHLIGERERVF